MYLNYDFIKTFKLFLDCFKYNIMISIVLSTFIYIYLIYLNKDRSLMKYIVSAINIILIVIISVYYYKGIFTLSFNHPLNNIYFYIINSIIYLILISIIYIKEKYIKIDFIIYFISLINILFSIFMTMYLKNVTLIVIGNIYPMIKFGNIIYILYYIYVVIKFLFLTKKI